MHLDSQLCKMIGDAMSAAAFRGLTRRRRRSLQRAVHLVAGFMLVVDLYAPSVLGAGFTAVLQWVLVPVVGATGVVMWKGPRIRRALRRPDPRDA
jgi:hypothetical protein